MGDRRNTHVVEMRADVVVKRYRSWSYGQPEREWRALKLLHEHVPGVAPVPVSAHLDEDPPTVVMSRLSGAGLEGPVTTDLADAIAETLARIHEAIPQPALTGLPPRAGDPVELLNQVRGWSVAPPDPHGDAVLSEALAAGADWVRRPTLEKSLMRPAPPVFGTGDGNLANYLWDGTDLRLVDFEYSGRSDRAFELAEVVEHISVRASRSGMTRVLDRFELSAAELRRFRECRRLLALYWLLRIPAHSQRQPGDRTDILAEQATWMLTLL
ncbi:phosphotransferase [Microtetraspora malaysiensis]|uniref:phosphotransferase n=1 Tax=Microtetraspora malaysiensis TaxID=161358 RepID=UPI003D8F12B4